MRKGEIACYMQFLLFSQCFPQLYIFIVRQNVLVCGNGLIHETKLVIIVYFYTYYNLLLRNSSVS